MMVFKRRLLLGARSGEWFFVNPPQQGRKVRSYGSSAACLQRASVRHSQRVYQLDD